MGLPSSLSHASELQGQRAERSPGASAFRAPVRAALFFVHTGSLGGTGSWRSRPQGDPQGGAGARLPPPSGLLGPGPEFVLGTCVLNQSL